jgi:hypothetical protein
MQDDDTDRRRMSELQRTVDRHDDRLGQLATVPGVLIDIDRRLAENERRMGAMEARLIENTTITQQIRDAQIAGKVVTSIAKWVAGLVLGAAALWAAISQLRIPRL